MSTVTASTVSDICQIISDLRGESSINTNANRIRAVSLAYQDFSSRMLWRTHILPDQTATGDGTTSSFTIGTTSFPMRTKGLSEVFVGGTTEDKRMQIVDYFIFKREVYNNAAAKVCYEYYDAASDLWKVKINPIPASGATIYYTYFWQPPTLTATTDKVVCEDVKIIAQSAMADIYHGEDELQKEQLARQEAEQHIADLIGLENSPAHNQLYTMGSIENSVASRGIGSY